MKISFKSIRMSAVVFLLTCLLAPKAHAYLDPGSGSMMLQLLLAGVAGVALAAKMFWRRILAYFRRSKSNHSNNSKAPS